MAEAKPNMSNLDVRVCGKLNSIEKFDAQSGPIYENLIIIPAAGEYDSPTRITVKSTTQLGRENDIVDVQGSIRSRYFKPQNGGRVRYNSEIWLKEN